MATEYKQVNDNNIVGEIWFYVKTYKFFHHGLKMLLNELSNFDNVVKDFGLTASPFEQEKWQIEGMIRWGEKELNEAKEEFGEIRLQGVSYGSLRYLKAGGLLQIRRLEQQRQSLIEGGTDIPKKVIQSIDEKIKQMRDMIEQGVLNGLKPADVFLEIDKEANIHEKKIDKDKTKIKDILVKVSPLVIKTEELQIIDDELRLRCLNLLNALKKSKTEQNQLDTIVREMSVILEDRIRKVAGIEEKLTSQPLMSKAFSGNNPILIFSEDKDLQENAHLLYRGFSGYVRNEVMHKLIHTFTKERVLQLLGFVDYLLFLLTQAKKSR